MVLIPEPERRGGLTTPRGLADVSVPESHERSLLLHKVILSTENWKNASKVHFRITIMARKT